MDDMFFAFHMDTDELIPIKRFSLLHYTCVRRLLASCNGHTHFGDKILATQNLL